VNARRLSAAALVVALGTVPLAAGSADAAVSKTRAKKSAHAAVLTAKDLPGYLAVAVTPDPDPASGKAEKSFYKCTGNKAPTYVFRDYGTAFDTDAVEIDSSADIAPSAKAARKDFRAWNSSKSAACFKKVTTDVANSSGGAVDALTVKAMKAHVSGADAVTALHLKGKFYADRSMVHLDSYQLTGIVGNVEFTLVSYGYETGAPSLSKLESLARTLVKRIHKS
jgi:hypothetical protein